MPSASSWIAARTMSATLRLWPRCMTSAPCACSSRRIMLIAASWPSNSDAALTKRSGALRGGRGLVVALRPGSGALGSDSHTRFQQMLLESMIAPVMTVNHVHAARAPSSRPARAPSPWRTPQGARRSRPQARGGDPRRGPGVQRSAVITTPRSTTSPRALEVTKPTIYYYVENKEQLLFECFCAGLEPIRAAFGDARASDEPARERLRMRAAALRPGHRLRVRLVHGARRGPGPGRRDARPRQDAEVGDRPGHPAPAPRGDRRRLDRRLRPEDDRLRARRRAELDRALVSRQPVAVGGRRSPTPSSPCSSMACGRARDLTGQPSSTILRNAIHVQTRSSS